MSEPPPEELYLRHPQADVPSADEQSLLPRWVRGEIKTKLWQVLVALATPIPFAMLIGAVAGEWAVGGLALLLFQLVVVAVLLGCTGGVIWDETGVTLTLFGWKRKHLPWSRGLTVGIDRLELNVDGKQVAQPMFGLASRQDKAWFAAAVLQHGPTPALDGLDKRQRQQLSTRLFNLGITIKKQSSALAERKPARSAVRPGLYVPVVKEAVRGELDAVVTILSVAALMVFITAIMLSQGKGLPAFLGSVAVLAGAVSVLRRRRQVAAMSGYNKADTVEVTDQGVRVWRGGQPTPFLQYPRRLTINPGRSFPGGEVEVWSDGEQTYAIDWRYLGRLPDDAPPCFFYAATEGDGWPDQLTKEAATELKVVRGFGIHKR